MANSNLDHLLGHLHEQHTARLESFPVKEVNETEATLKSIQAETCPRRKLVHADCVISDFESATWKKESAGDKVEQRQLEKKTRPAFRMKISRICRTAGVI